MRCDDTTVIFEKHFWCWDVFTVIRGGKIRNGTVRLYRNSVSYFCNLLKDSISAKEKRKVGRNKE